MGEGKIVAVCCIEDWLLVDGVVGDGVGGVFFGGLLTETDAVVDECGVGNGEILCLVDIDAGIVFCDGVVIEDDAVYVVEGDTGVCIMESAVGDGVVV